MFNLSPVATGTPGAANRVGTSLFVECVERADGAPSGRTSGLVALAAVDIVIDEAHVLHPGGGLSRTSKSMSTATENDANREDVDASSNFEDRLVRGSIVLSQARNPVKQTSAKSYEIVR